MTRASVRQLRAFAAAILLAMAGCGGESASGPDGGADASANDGSVTTGDASSGTGPSDAGSPDAGDADAGATCLIPEGGSRGGTPGGRVPKNHRTASASCPQTRGGFVNDATCGCASDGGSGPDGGPCACGACGQDSDCKAGANGRCENIGPDVDTICSYDECFTDSDCEGGVPCYCRSSGASFIANQCITESQCSVDTDCGPGGYCSPSLVYSRCVCLSTALCDNSTKCIANGVAVPCACGDSCGHGYFCHTRCDTCVDDSDCPSGQCSYDRLAQVWTCTSCLPVP